MTNSSTRSKSKIVPILAGILIFSLLVMIAFFGVQKLFSNGSGSHGFGSKTVVVKGVIGSEKKEFFDDPKVVEIFRKNGLDVQVSTSGSWTMAEQENLTSNDFAFPASEVSAEHIVDSHKDKVKGTYKPFFSPIAIATFQPVIDVLEKNGAAKKENGVWTIDMKAYLDLASKDVRWKDLKGSENYRSPRTVMMTSTDVRTSNSAGMYLSLASYVKNGEQVVPNVQAAQKQIPELSPLFVNQGFAQTSSAGPFENYLTRGAGETPMVVIYESQFFEEQIKQNSRITDQMVLAYPSPTIFSTHTGVTFSENGDKLMKLLENDPELAKLEAQHGFRPNGTHSAEFDKLVKSKKLEKDYRKAGDFIDLASTPSYEVMNTLLTGVSKAYESSGTAPEKPAVEGKSG